MTILSFNTFSSLPPALSDAGSDTAGTGNDQAFGSSEAPCLLEWPLSVLASMGGVVRAALELQCASPDPQPGPAEQAGTELKKGGVPLLLESLGGAHPIGHRSDSAGQPID
jgi:hypothetical protein